MKVLKHPNYSTLPIYVAETPADKAEAGKFFVTVKSKVLSMIASDAYGSGKLTPTLRINNSKYNQQHCIYRSHSTSCKSPIVPGNLAGAQKSWNMGAWLSLCPADRQGTDGFGLALGTLYQIIWVPPADGREPWDLEVVDKETKEKITPPDDKDETKEKIKPPPDDGDEPVKKAGIPWWLGALLGGGALITVIVFAVRDKKKGKKKGKR